ncbi:hypothetical protein SAY86_002785 [Trapa natans]|uniref:C2H2-type domain-containing protein n=1 Tax=Trapa natans TaxID=22666 RepID=A0AAN7LUD8_TRANT|nr:hypothetical protein SAY86_002785 [Trapa natans]
MGGLEQQPHMAGLEDQDRPVMITKGKRSRRPKTLSSCGGGTAATSSSSICGGGGGGDYEISPSSSSGATTFQSTEEEEEEDMAYCLILLASGDPLRRGEEADVKVEGGDPLRSKRKLLSEVTTKAGFYVYECKTCSRTFPSFQALGGHRASHKKPRSSSEDAKKIHSDPISDQDEEAGQFRKISINPHPVISSSHSKLLLQGIKPKIHECSICGLEFSSGQALGGHMRRHRVAAATPSPTLSGGLVTMNIDSAIAGNRIEENSSHGAVLSLDLNLPAAPEDDRNFQFTAASMKPILFSGPTLVDCHY